MLGTINYINEKNEKLAKKLKLGISENVGNCVNFILNWNIKCHSKIYSQENIYIYIYIC